jgi:hypothetical protein
METEKYEPGSTISPILCLVDRLLLAALVFAGVGLLGITIQMFQGIDVSSSKLMVPFIVVACVFIGWIVSSYVRYYVYEPEWD